MRPTRMYSCLQTRRPFSRRTTACPAIVRRRYGEGVPVCVGPHVDLGRGSLVVKSDRQTDTTQNTAFQ